MCAKGLSSIQDAYNPNRITHPLKRKGPRGAGEWERIDWEEALGIIAGKMKESIIQHGARSIAVCQGTGRGYNRYTFRFARSIGTPNMVVPSDFCYGPRLAVFGMMVGGRLYCDYPGWGGEYPRGKIKQVAQLFAGMDPRVVVAQASWWYPEEPGPEHGVWKSNVNVLTPNGPPYDPAMGSVTFRALLCRIYKVEEE